MFNFYKIAFVLSGVVLIFLGFNLFIDPILSHHYGVLTDYTGYNKPIGIVLILFGILMVLSVFYDYIKNSSKKIMAKYSKNE